MDVAERQTTTNSHVVVLVPCNNSIPLKFRWRGNFYTNTIFVCSILVNTHTLIIFPIDIYVVVIPISCFLIVSFSLKQVFRLFLKFFIKKVKAIMKATANSYHLVYLNLIFFFPDVFFILGKKTFSFKYFDL
jgi:hypothetical protein